VGEKESDARRERVGASRLEFGASFMRGYCPLRGMPLSFPIPARQPESERESESNLPGGQVCNFEDQELLPWQEVMLRR
jgi:hypothetical protein